MTPTTDNPAVDDPWDVGPSAPARSRGGRGRWPRRLWRAFLAIVLVALGLVFGLLRWASDPQRLARFLSEKLSERLAARVVIAAAEFDYRGFVALRGVSIDLAPAGGGPGPQGVAASERLLRCESITLEHDVAALLAGRFTALAVVLDQPTVYATQELATERLQWSRLARPPGDEVKPGEPSGRAARPPGLYINQGRVILGEVTASGEYHERATVPIEGLLRRASPGDRDDPTQAYLLSSRGPAGRLGTTFRGVFDPLAKTSRAEMTGLKLKDPLMGLLPIRARHFIELMQLDGDVVNARFNTAGEMQSGEVELARLTLRPPWPDWQDTVLRDVGGRLRFDARGLAFDLRGRAHDEQYDLQLAARGHVATERKPGLGPAFTADIDIEHAHLRGIPTTLPPVVQRQLRIYQPAGKFRGKVQLTGGEGKPVKALGDFEMLDMGLVFEDFPYPLHRGSGRIRFDDYAIQLENLYARGASGAHVWMDGMIGLPKSGGLVDFTIRSKRGPIDDLIFNALKVQQPGAIEQIKLFLDEAAYARLLERGLVQTAAQAASRAAELERLRSAEPGGLDDAQRARFAELDRWAQVPAFDLGGEVAIAIRVTRTANQPGVRGKWGSFLTIDLADAQLLYHHWPYPMRCVGGTVTVEGPRVAVHGVVLQGLRGGEGVLTGTVQPTDLLLAADGIPTDELLLSTVAPPQDDWLRRLNLQGAVAFNGTIRDKPAGGVGFRIAADIQNAKASPYRGQYDLQNVNAQLLIEPGRLTLDSVQASHGESRIQASGVNDANGLDLTLAAQHLRFEDPILDLAPPGLEATARARSLKQQLQLSGLFDAQLRCSLRPNDDHPTQFLLKLMPRSARLVWNRRTLDFHEASGRLDITPEHIDPQGLRAKFEHGEASVTGSISLRPGNAFTLELDARADRVCPVTRALLPDDLLEAIDALELKGPYELRRGVFTRRPAQGDAPDRLSFEGPLMLEQASLNVGIPLTQVRAQLDIQAQLAGKAPPTMDIRINAPSLLADGRQLQPLTARVFSVPDRPELLRLQGLRADVYGGVLVGEGEVDTAAPRRFGLSLTLRDANYAAFTDPEGHPWPAVPPDAPSPGTVSASLKLEGQAGPQPQRRGRGEVQVRDARLFEMPLALSLLKVLNFAAPGGATFDRAEAGFLVEGDRLKLERVAFQSPNLEFFGDGYMHAPSRRIDLLLHTRNPAAPRVAVLTEIFDVIKDSLISLHVTGTLRDPKPQALSARNIQRTWQQVFGPLTQPLKE